MISEDLSFSLSVGLHGMGSSSGEISQDKKDFIIWKFIEK
jgi:hypothetical protein